MPTEGLSLHKFGITMVTLIGFQLFDARHLGWEEGEFRPNLHKYEFEEIARVKLAVNLPIQLLAQVSFVLIIDRFSVFYLFITPTGSKDTYKFT